jgi:hypothetical protein
LAMDLHYRRHRRFNLLWPFETPDANVSVRSPV